VIDDDLGGDDDSVNGDFDDVHIHGGNYFRGDDLHADADDDGHSDHYGRRYFV
jgi:hypothetical protein